jgi:DNA-binding transcriptional MerR regulator
MKKVNKSAPIFLRGEVAAILDVKPLTIYNRELRKQYPPAKRDLNNYRIYTLEDVIQLQLLTFGQCDPKRIFEVLYDKGYTDVKSVTAMVAEVLNKKLAYE